MFGGGGGGGVVPKLPLLTFLLYCCYETLILNTEASVKSAKCTTPFFKSIDTLQLKTHKVKILILFHFTKVVRGILFYHF